jgi:hypothetical protein
LTSKQAANAAPAEIDRAKSEAAARYAARDAAQKLVESRKAEIAKAEAALARDRAEQSAKVAAAEKAAQESAARIAALQQQPPVAPPAAPADSPAAQELAKAGTAFEQSQERLAAAQAGLDKWRAAQVLQGVHNARQLLADKKAAYENSVQAAKDAPLAVQRARGDLAAAQKTTAESPARLKEKEAIVAQARQELNSKQAAVETARALVKEKEAALKSLPPASKTSGTANTGALAKKIADITAEIARRREVRSTFTLGTSEYAEADAKVQALKPALAAAQTALDTSTADVPNPSAPDTQAAQAGILKAREALNAALADSKPAAAKLAAAEKILAALRTETRTAAELAARLRQELPGIEKSARASQAQAEQAAKAAAREVESAKAEAERRRAAYESLKAAARLTRG